MRTGKGKEKWRIRCIRFPRCRHFFLKRSAAFDTYSLKQDLQDEIKSVE